MKLLERIKKSDYMNEQNERKELEESKEKEKHETERTAELNSTANPHTPTSSDTAVKKRKPKHVVYVLAAAVVVLAVIITSIIGCNTKSEDVDFTIVQNQKEVEYTESGDPIDPLTLVSIYRTTETTKEKKKDEKPTIEEGLEVTANPTYIDTSRVGDNTITFVVKDTKHNDVTKKLTAKFTVVNKDAPAFKLTDTKKEIKVGDKFDASKLVKDDAGLKLVEEEPQANEDGTYAEGWYTITSNVKTDKAGTYEVTFHAVGTNGVALDQKVTVTVKEAETEKKDDTKSNSSKTSTDTKTAKSGSTSTKSNTTTSSKNNSTASSNSNKSNSGSNASNNSGSNSSSGNNSSGSAATQPKQTCKEVYHDAEGHWETVVTGQTWVQDTPDTYEDDLVCNCGQHFGSGDAALQAWEQHDIDTGHGGYKVDMVLIPGTGHYEDVTSQKYVIDKQAWTETVCK